MAPFSRPSSSISIRGLLGKPRLAPGPAIGPATCPIQAGVADAVITPHGPVWLGGFSARNHPSEGVVNDLHARALALEDALGNRAVIVTLDLLGLSRSACLRVARSVRDLCGLEPRQLLVNFSHTHSGPFVPGLLDAAHDPGEESLRAAEEYLRELPERILDVVDRASANQAPARLSFGRGSADFAVNRRVLRDGRAVFGVNPRGPVDRSVPVLRVDNPDGTLRAILFGYACHNTTLTAESYSIAGDYAGFARQEIEQAHPGAQAMFLSGCGGDANPHPRGSLKFATQHGHALAEAVRRVLATQLAPLDGPLASAREEITIPYASVPTPDELRTRLDHPEAFVRHHARLLLDLQESAGALPAGYPYTIQVVSLGGLVLVGLAGEPAAEYSLHLRRELGETTWVAGYANDVGCYLPSSLMVPQGGYEVVESAIYYGIPGSFTPEAESLVVGRVNTLVHTQAGSKHAA